jgi:23S rRNA (cytosine1962-C5)-methyltransferase
MAQSRKPELVPAKKSPKTTPPKSPFARKSADQGPSRESRQATQAKPARPSSATPPPISAEPRLAVRPSASLPPGAIISRRASERIRQGHLWVYATDVESVSAPNAETLLPVADNRGLLLGTALYSPASQIALRLIAREAVTQTKWLELLAMRLRASIQRRKPMLDDRTNACRLVYSEADNLPGLIVDKYANIVVVQLLAKGLDNAETREAVVGVLSAEIPGPLTLWERPDPRIRELEDLSAPSTAPLYISNPNDPQSATPFLLNGLTFHFDVNSGQKTGAFLDQRQNYLAAATWAKSHGAKKALDICTYQGGFALHLAQVCQQVTGVDASRASLEVAERNLSANQTNAGAPGLASETGESQVDWIEADAFELLRSWSESPEHSDWDMIVLDPPAFAKSKRAVEGALRGYKELNLRALKMLRPGGLLVTCSCSHHVSWTDLEGAVASAAIDANRRVTLLERRGAALDHPVLLNLPETEYLKCLICQVD